MDEVRDEGGSMGGGVEGAQERLLLSEGRKSKDRVSNN